MTLEIFPIINPVAIFTLIISLILVVPYVSKKINVPPIFGLILAGLVIGPNGAGLLHDDTGISIFSAVGLLYIMFLAALEINLTSFLQNKNKSIFFGSLTFFVPLIIGFIVLTYVFKFAFLPSLLVSSMFSTHTLLSYPIVSRLNITRRESVVVTIGGTIITDTAVLILLSVITAAYEGKLNGIFWLQLILSLIGFVFIVLWGLPKLARWFFKTFQSDSVQQYIFVLVAMFLSAMLGKLAGIEPIVGAFLSGLALNRVIPHNSPLMNRTKFIGNSIFIPFFLISVGMLVDLKVLFSGFETIILAIVLIAIAILGKYLAAFFTQVVFKYSPADRRLIFGLSSSHAAATIAVISVGYHMQILNIQVLNGTILLILATCMVSSFYTENAARKIAIEEAMPDNEIDYEVEKIIVPISNQGHLQQLIDVAMLIRADNDAKIYPLTIVNDDEDAQQAILDNNKIMEELSAHAGATDTHLVPVTRLDINIPTGISRAAKELFATKIVIGWSGRSSTANYFFGNIIDELLENTRQMLMVTRANITPGLVKDIWVLVPENADREVGFTSWVNSVIGLSKRTRGKIKFLASSMSIDILSNRLKEYKFFTADNFIPFEYYPNISAIPAEITPNDLLIVISARASSLSYNRRQSVLPKLLSHLHSDLNFIIIYPEQIDFQEIYN